MDDLREAIASIPPDELRTLTADQLRDRIFALAANPQEAPDDPYRLARSYLKANPTLRYYRGDWYAWDGLKYRDVSGDELAANLTRSVKQDFDRESGVPKKVTSGRVGDAKGALKSLAIVPGSLDQPLWLGADRGPVLAAPNGLFRVPTLERVGDPTPDYFSTFALDYDVDPDAPEPVTWLGFLKQVWPDAPDCIATLQEWFGYGLTDDTSLQKILALIGQTRSGKGTVARVLTGVVGDANVAGPTLASLRQPFGLAPLVGKRLAVIADARLRGQTDIVTERMLSISGEDMLVIDRKFREPLNAKLGTRLMLLSNEVPKFDDASAALANRFIVLPMNESFLGREDPTLTKKCLAERPGILLWAIEGLRRLRERGKFRQPASGRVLVEDLKDLGSTIHAFVREAWRPGLTQADQYAAYQEWCERTGRRQPDSPSTFRRNLLAAYPDKAQGDDGALLATLATLPGEFTSTQAIDLGGEALGTALGGRLDPKYLGMRLAPLVDQPINGLVVRKRTLKGNVRWKIEAA